MTKNPIRNTTLAFAAVAATIGFNTSAQAQSRTQVATDVLIGYTQSVTSRRGGRNQVNAAIRQGIARANKANRDSRTQVYFSTAGFYEFDFNDNSGDLRAHYTQWRQNQAGRSGGKTLTTLENERKVDLACLITKGGGIRGIAGVNGSYSAVTEGQIQFHTMGHEWGHNFGCGHGGGHTMATANGARHTFLASGGKSNNTIVDLYSNPFVKYQGQYTAGIQNNPMHYNALVMFNSRFTRANRRTGLWNGGLVHFKSHLNAFVNHNFNGRMSAREANVGFNQRFRVLSFGSQWAFRGGNGRYVSSNNGSSAGMACDRPAVQGWERFNQTVTGGQIGLQGVGGYVSDENNQVGGSRPLVANRPSIGGWEKWYIVRP